jgi:hypothetical protein
MIVVEPEVLERNVGETTRVVLADTEMVSTFEELGRKLELEPSETEGGCETDNEVSVAELTKLTLPEREALTLCSGEVLKPEPPVELEVVPLETAASELNEVQLVELPETFGSLEDDDDELYE